jgi:Domain of unknown function (DUF4188)
LSDPPALKRYLASDPRLRALWPLGLTVCSFTENLFYSLFPLHVGMRQYWRDFESLERFTRAEPHREWWKQYLRDTGGTGFWHELYSVRGGFESIYVDVQHAIGFLRFAMAVPAKGGLFSSRRAITPGRSGGHFRAVFRDMIF